MSQRVFVYVNGIMNFPGDAEGWTDRAVAWTHCRSFHRAEKWEYATGPILRRLKQQERAEKIATMLGFYERAGFEIVLVGHSNGCDIIARVLALRGAEAWYYQRPIRSVHLIAAAADAKDFQMALEGGDVARVFFYTGGNDLALLAGSWSKSLFGWAGLGYGSVGRERSPLHGEPGVICIHREEFKHSTWLTKGEHFEETMQLIHRNDDVFDPLK